MHRFESRALVTVGGARNEVLREHPNTCHHCGFYPVPVDRRCVECGIQYHAACGPPMSARGRCEICEGGGRRKFPSCFLCDVPCDVDAPATSTDRLSLRIVYHGLCWRRARTDRVPADVLVLGSDSTVARRLGADAAARFLPDELPEGGERRMRVAVEGVGAFVSVPLVVHSWCALCLFDVDCSGETAEWREALLTRMFSCGSLPYGTAVAPTTWGGAPCQFCGSDKGWLTFCFYHLEHAAGCDQCRDPDDETLSRHAFHPSCAVRYGMQRLVRDGAAGMVCGRNRSWHARRMPGLRPWIGLPSGINDDLVDPRRLLPCNFTDGAEAAGRKGSLYGESMIPMRHRAAPHKRERPMSPSARGERTVGARAGAAER